MSVVSPQRGTCFEEPIMTTTKVSVEVVALFALKDIKTKDSRKKNHLLIPYRLNPYLLENMLSKNF